MSKLTLEEATIKALEGKLTKNFESKNKSNKINPELLKLGKELVQLEDDYDPYAELYDEKYTMEQFKNEINTVDNYIDILIKYCFNSADNIENTTPEFAKRYRDMGNKFKVYKSKNLKTESLPKMSNIQGLESYSVEEIKRMAEEYIKEAMLYADYTQEELDNFKIIDMNIYGSRNRGTAREDSDLDIVFEYEGDFREDDLFNLLNDDEEPLMFDDIIVDFNPICAEKSGNMDSFMTRAKKYDQEILKKKVETIEKKQEECVCPVCGNEGLEYGSTELEDNSYGYHWECPNCKSKGIEWYSINYSETVSDTPDGNITGYEEGICPECNGEIDYGVARPDGMDLVYDYTCPNCSSTGSEYYNLIFDEHEILDKKNLSKKAEGIQDDRLANSIKWLKDSGYEEYKTGDKYTLLINTTKYNDEVVGAMFYGKSAKPQWHYRFRNMEELDNYTDKFLSNRAANEKSDAERREKRKLTKDHDIKVGDIFYTSWGYDQTNIDYYEVVAVRGSRIDLKELHQKYVGHDGQDDLVEPATGENRFKDDEIHTVSARADGTVTSLSSFEYPRKWDGKPDRQTDAYSGH